MRPDVCFVLGTRPNFVKAAPVYRMLRERHPSLRLMLVHTDQHYDDAMSEVFLSQLGLPQPDAHLHVGSGTHAEQTARALMGVEQVLLERRPRLVVVVGDVNSTLAAALAAVKVGVPVAHLEAGLRCYEPFMPEEHNRRLTDHLSSVLLAPSAGAVANLAREGLDPATVHLVGNAMIDSLLAHLETARANSPWPALGLGRHQYGLVTLHRPDVVDDAELLEATVEALCTLAESMPLVFPAHPRTLARLEERGLAGRLGAAGIDVLEPQPYLEFIALQAQAAFVLTDSGGVQEESSILGVPCFTYRNSTERPITVERGTNVLIGLNPERIPQIPTMLEAPRPHEEIPLWDGRAGERAADAIAGFLAENVRDASAAAERAADAIT